MCFFVWARIHTSGLKSNMPGRGMNRDWFRSLNLFVDANEDTLLSEANADAVAVLARWQY